MSGKRRADESDAEALAAVEIGDEEMMALLEIKKEQDRCELIVERDAVRGLASIWEKRRPVINKIPKFWLHALANNPDLMMFLQLKEDRDALSHLTDINIIRDPKEFRAYTIELHFSKNPYFSDSVIRKEYRYTLPPGAAGEVPDEDGITETMVDFNWERDIEPQAATINWKSDATNLVARFPRKIPDDDEEDDEDEDEDMDMGLESRFGSFFNFFTTAKDHTMGPTIVDDVFPNAVNYFLGQGIDGDSEEEEDSEADDSDAEEIDLEAPPKRKIGGRK